MNNRQYKHMLLLLSQRNILKPRICLPWCSQRVYSLIHDLPRIAGPSSGISRACERHAAEFRVASFICVPLRSPRKPVLTFFRRKCWTCRVCVHAKKRSKARHYRSEKLQWKTDPPTVFVCVSRPGLMIFYFREFSQNKVWATPENNGDVALFSHTMPCWNGSNFDGQRDNDKVVGF